MIGIDHLTSLLGRYFGEPEISGFLSDLGVTAIAKLKRGDSTAIVSNGASGIEVTFRDADALDVKTKVYPEGALVLSSVSFYGIKTDNFAPYTSQLPVAAAFGVSKQALVDLLGAPARDNLALRQVRWDLESYCVFAKFGEKDMIIFRVQLPVA